MRKSVWLAALALNSLLLVVFSPILFPALPHTTAGLLFASELPFLLILWSYAWGGTGLGLATTIWAFGGVGWAALAAGQRTLLWLPIEFLGMGILMYFAMKVWGAKVQERALQREHLIEQVNTLESDLESVRSAQSGLEERLQRYQKLRQSANAFSLTLEQDELLECIAQASGDLVEGADRVLLYLANLSTLTLGLKTVWRRSGEQTIKAKRGDEFDQWVMRQAQPLLVEEPATDFRFPHMTQEKLGRPLGGLLAVPLVSKHRFLGVLRLESDQGGRLGPDDLRLLRIVGDMASLSIENSRLYQRTEQLAITDDLTGLYVRNHFQEELSNALAQSSELHRETSILLIDIDRFKSYNDRFGHAAGDKLLRQMGQLLLRSAQPGELVARVGGEEFTLMMPKASLQEAVARAERIRQRVEATPVELRRTMTQTTISIGVACAPSDGKEVEPLMRVADERLYKAKDQGRNRVCSD